MAFKNFNNKIKIIVIEPLLNYELEIYGLKCFYNKLLFIETIDGADFIKMCIRTFEIKISQIDNNAKQVASLTKSINSMKQEV